VIVDQYFSCEAILRKRGQNIVAQKNGLSRRVHEHARIRSRIRGRVVQRLVLQRDVIVGNAGRGIRL